jgi:hypothetical protein
VKTGGKWTHPESHHHWSQKAHREESEDAQVHQKRCHHENGELEVMEREGEQRDAEGQEEGRQVVGEWRDVEGQEEGRVIVGELVGVWRSHPRQHRAHETESAHGGIPYGRCGTHEGLFAELVKDYCAKDSDNPPPAVQILGAEEF